MSATRPKARSPEHQRQPGELDLPNEPNEPGEPGEVEQLEELEQLEDIEELGDEAIIAQQTAAHALQPRANVSEESRSVVITEHPARRDTQPPRKSSAEQTLVIRDRRALDEMREKILRRQKQKEAHGRRALYLWGALGLAAFVLGGIVAFLATESQSADIQPPSARGDAPLAPQPAPAPAPQLAPNNSPTSPPRAVRLDDLPVEHKR